MKSIKTKGMILSFCLISLAILSLGVSVYYRFKTIFTNQINNVIVTMAQESADHLGNYINQFLNPLVSISKHEDIISMNWEKQKEILSSQINPDYNDIAVVDLNKIAHYMNGKILDLSDRDYVRDTLNGSITFSEVIISRRTGETVIMVGVPIINQGKVVGALTASLDVKFLQKYTLSKGHGEYGRAYIISEKGSIISKPNSEKSIDVFNLYNLASNDSRYLSFSNFVQNSHNQNSGYGIYEFANSNIIMGYSTVKETNWRVYIGTYEDNVYNELVGLKRMIISIMSVTLIGSLLIAYYFVGRFTKSIIELDHLFEQGARGNLTIRFRSKSKDEIGRVGNSFNRMMDKIKSLTQYDPLTSLLNQNVLEKDVESLVHNEPDQDFSLIMVSIDKFGFINETYGYAVGDVILCEIARRISTIICDSAKLYRLKGDKFVILYKNQQKDDDVTLEAQHILLGLKECYFINDKIININLNIGLFFRNESTREEDPLKAVTQAKNYAKHMGSNQVQVFEQKISNKLSIMSELQSDIIYALMENQFYLVYQPLFYLNDEKIAEVEALIRWNHPKRGILYPDKFIDFAEKAGTIVNIDLWVLETACKQLSKWKKSNQSPIILSINISSKTFETQSFISELVSIVNKYDIDPVLLQLEITERMVIKNVEESISKLNELRAMGIQIAIDDFGIGYSSLSYIVRLPIDSIKIDRSFIQNINNSREAKTIVSTIINLCKTLNLRVIAEGIENCMELDYLKLNQCDIGQGYYFSRPIDIVEIEEKFVNEVIKIVE